MTWPKTVTHHTIPFWSRYTVTPDGCWEWTGGCFDNGYGAVSRGGKQKKAHRVAWEEVNGPIPDGMLVLHRCDNPPCINPEHLWLGTNIDNQRDMTAKGRGRVGPRNGLYRHGRCMGQRRAVA